MYVLSTVSVPVYVAATLGVQQIRGVFRCWGAGFPRVRERRRPVYHLAIYMPSEKASVVVADRWVTFLRPVGVVLCVVPGRPDPRRG